jgi:mono/diheme cytochrome c family protein
VLRRVLSCVLLLALSLAPVGCAKMLRGYAATESVEVKNPPPESRGWSDATWGGYYALYADFGCLTTDNLATNALPWKLVNALPDVVPEPFYGDARYGWQPVAGETLRRFGVIYGATLVGPRGLRQRTDFRELPVGYARGTVTRSLPDITLEIASTNCSMCHLGRTWDQAGRPTAQVFWGVPNHSVDFDALALAVTRAALDPRATDEALLAAMKRRFPSMSEDELTTYRKYVLPAFKKAIGDAQRRWGSLHPWFFGGPGFSHGVAILRDTLAEDATLLGPAHFPPANVKIPNLYGVANKRRLLIDGSYDALHPDEPKQRFIDHLIAFLPVFGTSLERTMGEIGRLDKLAAFLQTIEPPQFPGPIDVVAAGRGAPLYARACAKCHGDRGPDGAYRYPNRRVPVDEIGTDPSRSFALDVDLGRRFSATDIGAYEKVEHTGSYLPPPLHGIWASAPYFHNGSVPTLWHVLSPAERPMRFMSGGHALDTARVGVACVPAVDGSCVYPPGYAPWSEPKLYDTTQPGRSNRGHELQVAGLTDAMKLDLIEYLKTL